MIVYNGVRDDRVRLHFPRLLRRTGVVSDGLAFSLEGSASEDDRVAIRTLDVSNVADLSVTCSLFEGLSSNSQYPGVIYPPWIPVTSYGRPENNHSIEHLGSGGGSRGPRMRTPGSTGYIPAPACYCVPTRRRAPASTTSLHEPRCSEIPFRISTEMAFPRIDRTLPC